jgi:hypothetical protein
MWKVESTCILYRVINKLAKKALVLELKLLKAHLDTHVVVLR